MPAVLETVWRFEPLTAKLKAAGTVAANASKAMAVAKNPAPTKIGIRLTGTAGSWVLMGTGGLAHIFEGGRQGGYVIQPGLSVSTKTSRSGVTRVRVSASRASRRAGRVGEQSNIAIRFNRGDGGFYRGPGFRGGAMRAEPYIGPAGAAFPAAYRAAASAAMRSGIASGATSLFRGL